MTRSLTMALAAAAFLCGPLVCGSMRLTAQTPQSADKYLWLEDVSSARSMQWVKQHDEQTSKVLDTDPRYAKFQAEALEIAENPDRLPAPGLINHTVYNLWKDAQHPHGLLRRTSIENYRSAHPQWETVLDYDALGKAEKVNWVPHGLDCLYPGDKFCLVTLSAGGEDASTLREFNLQTASFVPNGFELSHSKQQVAWLDHDTLLVSRDWGPGTMTVSGYPFVIKEWKRGTPLSDAKEIFRGKPNDVGADAFTEHDAEGHMLTLFLRRPSFFETRYSVQTPAGIRPLALPAKADLSGMLNGHVLVRLHENWTPSAGGPSFAAGSLLELQLADVLRDPGHLKPAVIFAPTSKEFLQSVAMTRNGLIVTTLDNVEGRAYVMTRTQHGWTRHSLPTPSHGSVQILSANDLGDEFFLGITGFLTPPSAWLGDAATGSLTEAKSEPPRFDASNDVVEQREATSKDGTRIPYFVVHRKDIQLNGSNPTLLTAYGGFEVSETPAYSANVGKLWLENGGVYVLANIRGGGEFGPAWHEAGLKTHRQRIYDDFAAVAEDLIARKVTSTPRLGIMGGSNGGLLMGVEMTEHPDLWKAIVIQVPLLDMLRFEHIAAGASWVGEYGSVSNPAERAFLASISPYQQLKPDVKYPTPFIFTTTKDDRVGPQHARKFAAKMEEFHEPFFYYEIVEGGHGAGADLKEEAGTWAMTYVYLARQLMDEPVQSASSAAAAVHSR
ncbi:MAG TPA: prolyl oligopeptidase family serine peptidase [Acidobacteriaceae bacterium]